MSPEVWAWVRRARETWSHPIRGGGRTGRGVTSEGAPRDPPDSSTCAQGQVGSCRCLWAVSPGSLPCCGAELAAGHTRPGTCGLLVAWEGWADPQSGRQKTVERTDLSVVWTGQGDTKWMSLSPFSSSLSRWGSDFAHCLSEEQLQGPRNKSGGKGGDGMGWSGAETPGCPHPSLAQLWAALSSPVGVELPASGTRGRFGGSLAVSAMGGGSQPCCPSEQPPSFLSAQPAPQILGLTTRMALGPATETFVLELRCLEDGGPGPDTISGEGLGGL